MTQKESIVVKTFKTSEIIEGISKNNLEVLDWIWQTYQPVVQAHLDKLSWTKSDTALVFIRTYQKIKQKIQFNTYSGQTSFRQIFEERLRVGWLDTLSGYMPEALLNNDSRVIRLFTKEISPIVWSITEKYTGSTESAEKIYAEAIWRVLENIQAGKYEETGSFKSYFLAVVTNVLRKNVRKVKREVAFEDYLTDKQVDDSFDLFQEREERLVLLEKLLRQADEQCTQVFDLFYWKGHRTKAIAQLINVSEESVRARLSRCRKKLKAAFARAQQYEVF